MNSPNGWDDFSVWREEEVGTPCFRLEGPPPHNRQSGIGRREGLAAHRRSNSWVAAIASNDAARAIQAAFTAPPGTYNVSDGQPVTQGAIHAVLEQAMGKVLHPLYDAS
jgi:hypothetical protein